MTPLRSEYFLRLINGMIDPATGRFIPNAEHLCYSEKKLWYAYDPDATCERWLDFLRQFPHLNANSIRDFLRFCACPKIQPQSLIVLSDRMMAEEISELLNLMFINIVPVTGIAMSSKKHVSLFKEKSSNPIVQLLGLPKTVEQAIKIRTAGKKYGTRVIFYSSEVPVGAQLPPHLMADLRSSKVTAKCGLHLEFIDERPGILNWALSRSKRQA